MVAAACAASADAPEPPQRAAPTPSDRPDGRVEDWNVAGDPAGLHVAWRSRSGDIARNQDQDLSVRLFDGATPVSGAVIVLRGWMPEHGHGFVQAPRVVEEGDGAYRIEGVRLHMRGSWQLFFDVRVSDAQTGVRSESILVELEV